LLFHSILYHGRKSRLVDGDGRRRAPAGERFKRVGILVLDKRHYFETKKTFPFTGAKDIRSAVGMDISSMAPFKTARFLVGRIAGGNGKTTVNIWFIRPELSDTLEALSPRLIIPESALLPFLDPGVGKIYDICADGKNLLAYVGADRRVMSMDGGDLVSFRRTIGAGAKDCAVTVIHGMDEYLSLLRGVLERMPLKMMSPFVNRDRALLSGPKGNLKWSLATAAALICLFISLSFLFPYFAATRLASEDKALSRNLGEVLKTREDVEYYLNRGEGLAKRINQYPYKIELVRDLNVLLPAKTRIRKLAISGNMVEIRGATPKGSALLSALGRGEKIKNVRFISRVRKDPKTGMELFSISFVYESRLNTEAGI